MIYRTRFSDRVSKPLMCTMEERKTKSEFADECDINKIMARYRKTGELPVTALQAADRFGDFSQVPDFQEMQNRVLAAHEMFAALPSDIRKRFNNDPGEFIDSAQSEEGIKLFVELGLAKETPLAASETSPKASSKGKAAEKSEKAIEAKNEA